MYVCMYVCMYYVCMKIRGELCMYVCVVKTYPSIDPVVAPPI